MPCSTQSTDRARRGISFEGHQWVSAEAPSQSVDVMLSCQLHIFWFFRPSSSTYIEYFRIRNGDEFQFFVSENPRVPGSRKWSAALKMNSLLSSELTTVVRTYWLVHILEKKHCQQSKWKNLHIQYHQTWIMPSEWAWQGLRSRWQKLFLILFLLMPTNIPV